MRKIELIIISAIVIVAVGALLFLQFARDDEADKYVKITVDGEVYDFFHLTEDMQESFTITTDYGENHVVIENGTVNVDWADCENQVCVDTKTASNVYDTIVCLPHKLVIEIVDQEQ